MTLTKKTYTVSFRMHDSSCSSETEEYDIEAYNERHAREAFNPCTLLGRKCGWQVFSVKEKGAK